MSNEPGGPAPLPDPYTVPGRHAPDAGPVPPAPSGYEAVVPPAPPYAAWSAAAPDPYPSVAAPPQQGPNPFAPPHLTGTPSPYGTPAEPVQPYGPPPTGSPYGQPAYGQPQYGSPAPAYAQYPPGQYGAPADGTPYGYPGGPVPPAAAQNEPLAIAAMVTSIAGIAVLAGLLCPVGLGLGIAALRKIRRTGRNGRGMAIAGVVVGAVGTVYLLGIVALIIAAVASGPSTYDDGYSYQSSPGDGSNADPGDDSTLPDYTLRTDLQTGDCLDHYAEQWDLRDATVVDCTVPHEGEVLGLVTLPAPVSIDLEEDDPVWDEAASQCESLAEDVLPSGIDPGDAELDFPHPDDFATGGTTAYCVYFTDGDLVTGSAVQHDLDLGAGALT